MSDCCDILISVSPTYTQAFLSGRKTVELRRRRMHVKTGTRVWIYSKVPSGRIEAIALVETVKQADLDSLWSEFQDRAGISRTDFDSYFAGCTHGFAVVLSGVRQVNPAMELVQVKAPPKQFHPPQFFKWLGNEEVRTLEARHKIEPQTGNAGDRLSLSGQVNDTSTERPRNAAVAE